MGLNGCRCIVGCEGDQDPLEMLCRHVEYEAALISPEHVGYGFDFCDSLSAAQSGLEISAEQGDALKDHRQIILLTQPFFNVACRKPMYRKSSAQTSWSISGRCYLGKIV